MLARHFIRRFVRRMGRRIESIPAPVMGALVGYLRRRDGRRTAAQGRRPARPAAAGTRGPPTYGQQRISLAKRCGQRRGWRTEEFLLYSQRLAKTFKTFLAT